MVSLSGSSVDSLRSHFRGELLVSGDAGYDEARALWNGDIDRRPALDRARRAASTMLPRRSGSPASTTSRSRCAAADTASRATASSTTA